MIGAHGRVPVFAYRRPVDLRKGFEGLSALVREALAQDPLSGALYLFTNRRRTTAKVLHFDGSGLGLYIKRLARGRFAALWTDDCTSSLSLTRPELELFLQGSLLVGKVPLAPAPMSEKELVVGAR
jgi:transposase